MYVPGGTTICRPSAAATSAMNALALAAPVPAGLIVLSNSPTAKTLLGLGRAAAAAGAVATTPAAAPAVAALAAVTRARRVKVLIVPPSCLAV